MPQHSLPINSPSLRLRHFLVEEAVRMMELNDEPTTKRWLPSHVYPDVTEATSRMRYLISCYLSPGDPRLGPFVLAVEHTASGALLGHVGFSPFENSVEVSYAIAEAARNRGYGSEALLHGCQWVTEVFSLPGILAHTEVGNTPSRRTLERAGFAHDEDLLMPFQGVQEVVSRYIWRGDPQFARLVSQEPVMPEFVLLMRSDVEDRAKADDDLAWSQYMTRIRLSGALRGGSSIGQGFAYRKGGEPQHAQLGIEGYITIQAANLDEARRFVEGNPNYEAGGTVEVRELPSGP